MDDKSFEELQAGLADALSANRAGSTTPHTVVAMASHSVNESLLSHYGDRVLALEHRFLVGGLMTHRLPSARLTYVASVRPAAEALHYLQRLGPDPDGFAARTQVVALDDSRPRSMAAKLLDRPDLLARLRQELAGTLAVIEPWNVTEHEVAVAEALQVPINGLDPRLRHLGHKSAGRRAFVRAGAPVAEGAEDIRTVDDLVHAALRIQVDRPHAREVVVKHDDSGAGDGNVCLDVRDRDGVPVDEAAFRRAVMALPDWYLDDLGRGGVVEERLAGARFSSPSCQVDLLPDGSVEVLSTHEQVLGGSNGQVFLGCRFPADPAYAVELARHSERIGAVLSAAGARGRASIDFGAVLDDNGRWSLAAFEVNLRKGGTSHPFSTLRNLVPGRYDAGQGAWVSGADHLPRTYVATDNFVDPMFLGLTGSTVISAVQAAGVEFDHNTGTGVVLHMLAGLGIDGRFGYTAIGRSPAHAAELEERARIAVLAAAARREQFASPFPDQRTRARQLS